MSEPSALAGQDHDRGLELALVQRQANEVAARHARAPRAVAADSSGGIVPGELADRVGQLLQPGVVGEAAVVDRGRGPEDDLGLCAVAGAAAASGLGGERGQRRHVERQQRDRCRLAPRQQAVVQHALPRRLEVGAERRLPGLAHQVVARHAPRRTRAAPGARWRSCRRTAARSAAGRRRADRPPLGRRPTIRGSAPAVCATRTPATVSSTWLPRRMRLATFASAPGMSRSTGASYTGFPPITTTVLIAPAFISVGQLLQGRRVRAHASPRRSTIGDGRPDVAERGVQAGHRGVHGGRLKRAGDDQRSGPGCPADRERRPAPTAVRRPSSFDVADATPSSAARAAVKAAMRPLCSGRRWSAATPVIVSDALHRVEAVHRVARRRHAPAGGKAGGVADRIVVARAGGPRRATGSRAPGRGDRRVAIGWPVAAAMPAKTFSSPTGA